jgi:ribonuclease HII
MVEFFVSTRPSPSRKGDSLWSQSSHPQGDSLKVAQRGEEANAKSILIAGVDEAGRGPLAGPLAVAAVILDPARPIVGLNDSKKLSEARREALFPQIIERALAYCIVLVEPEEIDRLNIFQATMAGMSRAVAGQDCTAATRVITGPKIYDRFVSELSDQVKSIKSGDPAEGDDIEMGSLIAQAQADKVEGMVDRARGGAEIVTGGVRPKRAGAFYEPTVIVGPDQKSEIVQDEVFGPVVTVQRFSDEEQAIKWANDVRFGLAASVWTSDAGKGMRVAKAIQFGTVWINDHFMLVSEMPHGGFKESGYGKDQSMYAVEDYTVVKHVMLKI